MTNRKEEILQHLNGLQSEANYAADEADTALTAAENAEYKADSIEKQLGDLKAKVDMLDDRTIPDHVIALLQDVKSGMSLVSSEVKAREGEEIGEDVIEFTETLDQSVERIEEWLEDNYYE